MMNEDLMMATFEYIMCFYLEANHYDAPSSMMIFICQIKWEVNYTQNFTKKNMTSKTFFLIIEFENISDEF